MIISVNDGTIIMKSLKNLCDGFIVKPITKDKLNNELVKIGLSVNSNGS